MRADADVKSKWLHNFVSDIDSGMKLASCDAQRIVP